MRAFACIDDGLFVATCVLNCVCFWRLLKKFAPLSVVPEVPVNILSP